MFRRIKETRRHLQRESRITILFFLAAINDYICILKLIIMRGAIYHLNRVNRKVQIDKTNLTKAFKSLRKAGYFARQNFMCCQSCAGAAIPDGTEKYVFYHNQDNDNLKGGQDFCLAWGGDGHEIVKILNENGLETFWEGNKNKRIMVKALPIKSN